MCRVEVEAATEEMEEDLQEEGRLWSRGDLWWACHRFDTPSELNIGKYVR